MRARGLNITTLGGTSSSGTVTITGANSTLTLLSNSEAVIGNPAGVGTARINVRSGGKLTTGTGITTVHDTLDLDSGGILDAGGDIDVDGGLLDVSIDTSVLNFLWAENKTMTVSNGGRVLFIGGFANSPLGATYHLTRPLAAVPEPSALFLCSNVLAFAIGRR